MDTFFVTLYDLSNQLALPLFVIGFLLLAMRAVITLRRLRLIAKHWQAEVGRPVTLRAHPLVSVLVAAWNEADNIEAHIRAFQALRYPSKELILCAGGNDNTYALAQKAANGDPSIQVLEQPAGQGKQRSLKQALFHAQGEIIYLTDADCLVNDNAFERVLAPLINDGADAATGSSVPLPRQRGRGIIDYLWAVDFRWNLALTDPSPGLLGRNCAVTRQTLEATGGFDRDAFSGTDYTLARQIISSGRKIRGVNTSIVESETPSTIQKYFKQRVRWLRNMIIIGHETNDPSAVKHALMGAGISIAFFVLPLFTLVLGASILALWGLLLAQALFARAVDVLLLELNGAARWRAFLAGSVLFWVDAAMRIEAVAEGMFPALRSEWKQAPVPPSKHITRSLKEQDSHGKTNVCDGKYGNST